MNAMTQIIMQQLAGGAVSKIAQRFGVSETTANTAVQLAIPLILSALARNASQPEGAESLQRAVNKDHDGSIFDNLMGYLGNPQSANGAGILGHVFGGQRESIEGNLAQATGIDPGSAGGLLEMIAPLVLGAVGSAQQQNGLDASGLSNLLNAQQQQAQENAPNLMGMVGSLLDQNQDGNSLDDLQRIASSFLK